MCSDRRFGGRCFFAARYVSSERDAGVFGHYGFKRIVKKAGIDPMTVSGKGLRQFTKRTFHSLRHSFNSALANAGVAEEIRMKLTGHQSRPMNERYTHLQVATLKSAVGTLPLFGAQPDKAG